MKKLLYVLFFFLIFSCKTANCPISYAIKFSYDKNFISKDSIDSICDIEEIPLLLLKYNGKKANKQIN